MNDLEYKGCSFTWRRVGEESTMIRERLDRFLTCEEWSTLFPHSWVRNYLIYKSDHMPVLLGTEDLQHGRGARSAFTLRPCGW